MKRSYIQKYIIDSSTSVAELVDDLSELAEFFDKYPKLMKRIFKYFKSIGVKRVTKKAILELLTDPGKRRHLGYFFDLPSEALNIERFKFPDCTFKISELRCRFDLRREGSDMSLCLADERYDTQNPLNADNRYFGIVVDDLRSTLKIRREYGMWKVVEHRAKFNMDPAIISMIFVEEFLKFLNRS